MTKKVKAGFCRIPISQTKSKPRYNLQGKKEREKKHTYLSIWDESVIFNKIKTSTKKLLWKHPSCDYIITKCVPSL